MAAQDGNGWVHCPCGRRHWGRHGAAGLLLARPSRDPAVDDDAEVLLQLRADWTHEGGTWGVPGGARDSHEDEVAAALREAAEEAGLLACEVEVVGRLAGLDHGVWSYTYVLARCARDVATEAVGAESDELRWVGVADVATLPLHSGLATAWPSLRVALRAALAAR